MNTCRFYVVYVQCNNKYRIENNSWIEEKKYCLLSRGVVWTGLAYYYYWYIWEFVVNAFNLYSCTFVDAVNGIVFYTLFWGEKNKTELCIFNVCKFIHSFSSPSFFEYNVNSFISIYFKGSLSIWHGFFSLSFYFERPASFL